MADKETERNNLRWYNSEPAAYLGIGLGIAAVLIGAGFLVREGCEGCVRYSSSEAIYGSQDPAPQDTLRNQSASGLEKEAESK